MDGKLELTRFFFFFFFFVLLLVVPVLSVPFFAQRFKKIQ
jgi:hypothetical protein